MVKGCFGRRLLGFAWEQREEVGPDHAVLADLAGEPEANQS
jgi:hypothetical protein